jgi:hypothetical protein
MAKLTDQLGTDYQVKPVRQPPAPSTGLADIFSMAGKAINTVQTTNARADAEDQRKAAAARQKAEDDYRNVDRGIDYEASMAIERANQLSKTVFADPAATPADPETQQLNKDFDAAFGKMQSVQAAVDQGRMPQISFGAAINKEYLALLNRFPDHGESINKFFKERGFVPSMAQQTAVDQQSSHDNERESIEKVENDAFEKGLKVIEPELAATMSRQDVIAHGIAADRSEYQLDLANKKATLTLTQKNIDKETKEAAETERDDDIARTVEVDALNNTNPIRSALQEAMTSIGKLPPGPQREAFAALGPRLKQYTENYVNQAVTRAVAAGYKPDKVAQLRASLEAKMTGLTDMFQGDFTLAKAENDAFQSVQTRLGLNMSQALPTYTALKKLGMNAADIDSLVGGVAANPDLAAKLKKEFQGFTGEFGEERASTHLTNVVRMLRGETNIAEYNPTQARAMMPTLYRTTVDLTTAYNQGRNSDASTMLGGVGNLISAARTLNPSSGLSSWTQATGAVAGRGTRQALLKAVKDPQHNDLAEAVIQGSRAASAQILDSMRPNLARFSGQGWSLQIKDGLLVGKQTAVNGRFNGAIGPDGKLVRGKPGPGYTTLLPMPQNVKQFMDTWNANIANLQILNAADPSGNKKASPRDIGMFYGANQVPESFKNKDGVINPQFEINKQLDNLEKAFDRVPDMNTNVPNPQSSRVMNYQAKAVGYNEVPDSVKTLGQASEFAKKVNAAGAPSSAMGTYQIVGSTLRTYARRIYGENWHNVEFTPEVQDRIAQEIFEHNKGTAEALKHQWVSLSSKTAERIRHLPWEEARGVIAAGESG